MPLTKRRKKYSVDAMEPNAVSWVKQGAVPGDNTLLIQGQGENDEQPDVHELLQSYADRLSETDEPKDQLALVQAMASELFDAITEPETVAQEVPNLAEEVAETRAWNGGSDAWWAFQCALWKVESPEELEQLVDQLAAFLKMELTATVTADGDEPRYMRTTADVEQAAAAGAGAGSGDGAGAEKPKSEKTGQGAAMEPKPGAKPVTQGTEDQEPAEEGTAAGLLQGTADPGAATSGTSGDAAVAGTAAVAGNAGNAEVAQATTDETEDGETEADKDSVSQAKDTSDVLGFLNGIKPGPVQQGAGAEVAQAAGDGTITLTRDQLKALVTEVVKQASSDVVKEAVQQATGRPRPVGSQQVEEGGDGARRPVKQSSGSVWAGGPFDAIRR